ncbi:glycosyltransferase family 2 protein [Arachidicoccus sp.]|uniref:glycosyltransferase family 2 protein n=1 Tax=Arachidicoccus sp. TaxID=1872624 RepID=UPI003D25D591
MLRNEVIAINTASPFFSVVITTYNRAVLLNRAINSLIAQTEKDWEVIIIDDESTDDTASQILKYLQPKIRIRYVQQLSKGYAGAKNTGIFLSLGKYITFLDSDDEYAPTHLEIRKKLIKENHSPDFLHGGVKIIGSPFVPDKNNYGGMINLSECVIGGTFFIRRQLAFNMGGFPEIPLGSDAALFEKISKIAPNIIKTEVPTYIYHRENENSITNNLTRLRKISV